MSLTKQLYKNTLPSFKPMLGKRVTFTDKNGKQRFGVLQFAGFNKVVHKFEFQVTVNRCPYWGVDIHSLGLAPQ